MSEIMRVNTNDAYRREIENELKEKIGENFTANDVLTHFFGEINNDYRSYSRYTLRRYVKPNQSVIQRVNILWVLPLYVVFFAPIKWVVTGSAGVRQESKTGRALLWLIGSY